MFVQTTYWAHILGMTGLVVLAFCAWNFSPGVDVGLIMMLIGSLRQQEFYPQLWRQWLWRFIALWALFICASAIWAGIEFPSSTGPQSTAAYRWSKLLLFFLPAYWLARDKRASTWVFWVSLTGFLMMLIAHADWREMLSFNISKRADFGMRDANELAVPCLIYLLGLFVFIPRMLCQFTHRWFWVWLMTWSILCYVFSYALLASQSRQAWLALGVILPFVVTIRYYVWFTQNPTATRKAGWLILPIVLVIVLIAGNQNFLCQRLTTERIDVMHTVLNKDAQADTNTSVGARLNMFKFGIDKWLERPILGWGIGSTQYLTKSTHDKRVWASDPFDPLIGDHGYYANLHNIYAEILLRTGIIGALGWLTIVLAVYWALWQEYRLGNVQMDVFLYVVGLGAAICILGWFSFHVGNNRSCAYWLLLMGTAYSFRLRRAFSYEKI